MGNNLPQEGAGEPCLVRPGDAGLCLAAPEGAQSAARRYLRECRSHKIKSDSSIDLSQALVRRIEERMNFSFDLVACPINQERHAALADAHQFDAKAVRHQMVAVTSRRANG